MDNKMPLVYIIILTYNNYIDTWDCIKSLESIEYNNFNTIVIDNCSEDDSFARIKQSSITLNYYKRIHFIQNSCNLGYAAGNNEAIRYAISQGAQYICILNNDVIVSRNFLNNIIYVMECNKNIAISGPVILENNNVNIIQSAGCSIDYYKGAVNIYGWGDKYVYKKDMRVCDCISGACIVAKIEYLSVIGLIPEAYFLYFEETEWCVNAKKNGYNVTCVLNSTVQHKGSITTMLDEKKYNYFQFRNRVLFFLRNGNFNSKCVFLIYLFIQTIIRIVFKKYPVDIIGYYLDGLCMKIDYKHKGCNINNSRKINI